MAMLSEKNLTTTTVLLYYYSYLCNQLHSIVLV